MPSSTTANSFLATSYDGNIRSGMLSPALSAATSTTTTPITPMTPLTTPRTPAQALLLGGRRYDGTGPSGRGHLAGSYPRSSMQSVSQHHYLQEGEEEDHHRAKQLLALHLFSNFINQAEATLDDVTQREIAGQAVLGPGIVRACKDLADGIEEVANELRREYRRVTSNHDLHLFEEIGQSSSEFATYAIVSARANHASNTEALSPEERSREEYISTLSSTQTILIDLAHSLRAVSAEEAQELGEVAVEVARMFIFSLRMIQRNMIQMSVSNQDESIGGGSTAYSVKRGIMCEGPNSSHAARQHKVTWSIDNPQQTTNSNLVGLGPLVEILGEEEKKDEHQIGTPPKSPSPKSSSPPRNMSDSFDVNFASPKHDHGGRVRILWPPILPMLAEATNHIAQSARQHPLRAIAISLACGPAAVTTACILGPPVLISDWAIQSSYSALSETAIIENAEKGAANALQVAKLSLLFSKLVIKQSLTVGAKQIERRGGIDKICADVVAGAVDMATHPFETAHMAWDGLFWMGGAVRDAVGSIANVVKGSGKEVGMNLD
mmetsp:Transcript_9781/g.20563  ORF Transcript_9781/g.20563 Transcript_9781/m.20563 type:complete len:551 (-) Transcript_9781:116-1768(-)